MVEKKNWCKSRLLNSQPLRPDFAISSLIKAAQLLTVISFYMEFAFASDQ